MSPALAEDEPAEEVKKIEQHVTGTEEPDRRWGKESSCADRGIIVSANVTNFWTFLSTIDNMKGSDFAIQAHGILQRNMEAASCTAAMHCSAVSLECLLCSSCPCSSPPPRLLAWR